MAGVSRASPVDEGSSSARQEIDRAAQDQRGTDENGKTGLEPNSAQIPSTTAQIAAAYIELCHDPATNWRAWVAELDGTPRDLSTAALATSYTETCHNPLRDVNAWLAITDAAAPDLSTAALALGYVETCLNPSRNWQAWLAVIDDTPPLSPVAHYVQLCQNPTKDWRAWLADDQPRNTGGDYERLESTDWLCRNALQEMQSGMDAVKGGSGADRVHSRPPTNPAEFDGVQPVRREGRIDAAEQIEARQARRFAMLQRFMRAARFALRPIIPFRRRSKATGKGKGRATGGGSAHQLRTTQNRSGKRSAFLQKLLRPKGNATTPPRSVSRQRPPTITPPKI